MVQSLGTSSLLIGENRQPSLLDNAPAQTYLWAAVCFSSLILESQADASDHDPAIVIELDAGHLYIRAVNKSAHSLGIKSGMKLSSALAISSSLKVFERSVEAERKCLESMAAWCHQLTSIVSLEPPDAMLLEIGRSIELFAGIENIQQQIANEISKRCLSFRLSIAPTATGALWLARHEQSSVLKLAQLGTALRPLPLIVTGWPQSIRSRLDEMGIRTIGDCLRLPRDGFAKRVGLRYLQDLDKAMGKEVDLRVAMKVPHTFSMRIDFPSETSAADELLKAAENMIVQLEESLRQRQKQVRIFAFRFHHLHLAPNTEIFHLIEPHHHTQRFLDLFADRLERLALPAPVVALELKAGAFHPMHIHATGFFAKSDGALQRDCALIERLQERLGPRGIYTMMLMSDHRPEQAWLGIDEDLGAPLKQTQQLSPWANTRPLWLLSSPNRLASRNNQPSYRGALRICAGPERIESGWWDRKDVRRDYYVALSPRGERLWIYFDKVANAWYLHGLFG